MTTQTLPKDAQEGVGPPVMTGTEGRQGSAGSNDGGSKDQSSGEAETASEPQPPSVQQQVFPSPLSGPRQGRRHRGPHCISGSHAGIVGLQFVLQDALRAH